MKVVFVSSDPYDVRDEFTKGLSGVVCFCEGRSRVEKRKAYGWGVGCLKHEIFNAIKKMKHRRNYESDL